MIKIKGEADAREVGRCQGCEYPPRDKKGRAGAGVLYLLELRKHYVHTFRLCRNCLCELVDACNGVLR